MYQVIYRKSALKTLVRLPAGIRDEFRRAFELLAENPSRRDLDVKALNGREGCRLRVGQWRAIFRVEQDRLIILVLDIGPRGDVYK
jgi:mRNA interferase RelE/StbE